MTVPTYATSVGSNQLPLLLIEKFKNPRTFRKVTNLILVYKNQLKTSMTVALFAEWSDKIVYSRSKENNQKEVGKEGNVLLIVDNKPSHPSVYLLKQENGLTRFITGKLFVQK